MKIPVKKQFGKCKLSRAKHLIFDIFVYLIWQWWFTEIGCFFSLLPCEINLKDYKYFTLAKNYLCFCYGVLSLTLSKVITLFFSNATKLSIFRHPVYLNRKELTPEWYSRNNISMKWYTRYVSISCLYFIKRKKCSNTFC